MRKRITARLLLVIFVGTLLITRSAVNAQVQARAEAALKAAMDREVVQGDLRGALEQYKRIAESKDRAIAAKALIRMAECYQKLGDSEARKVYERVLSDYADQKESAAMARAHLNGIASARSTLVWQGEKVSIYGSVSLDGRYISFTDRDTGNLALHDLTKNEDRVIVGFNNSPGKLEFFPEQSSISPDNTKVAYSLWFDGGYGGIELWVAGLNGEPKPRRVYGDPNIEWIGPRDWSPDGRWIACTLQWKDGAIRLTLVSIEDGSIRVLKSGSAWPGARMFFSPDGKYLAYDLPRGATNAHDVWVTAVDATKDSAVVTHRANDVVMGWSPDRKHLLFASDRTGSMALWSLSINNGMAQGTPELLKPDMGLAESMGVTRAGALFYGTHRGIRGGSIEIATFDPASGALSSRRDVSTNPQENE